MNNYFPHDSNARNSDKLIPLRARLGAEGYGIYFMLIERLREESSYMSVKDYNMLAFDLRVDSGKVKSVIEDFGLFAFTDDGKCFYSESLMRRMKIKDAKSEKARQSAKSRWSKSERTANAPDNECERTANAPKSDAIKVKEIKRNKIKISSDDDTKSAPPSPPFVEEKFLKEFFCEGSSGEQDAKRLAALDSLRRSFGLPDMESMKDLARQVMADWKIRRHTPKDWEDAANHLVSTIRKKCAAKESQASGNGNRTAGNGKRSTENYIAELDRQVEKQKQDFEERQKNRIKPADYIRSKGYDPEKVTMAQVMNPNWCSNNPPTKTPGTETT